MCDLSVNVILGRQQFVIIAIIHNMHRNSVMCEQHRRRDVRFSTHLRNKLDVLAFWDCFQSAIKHALPSLRVLTTQLELAISQPNL
jgi:hypothetical protein